MRCVMLQGDSHAVCDVAGLVKLGHLSRYSTTAIRWCDAVMLCGRAPLSVRITTMETTLNRTFKVIEQRKFITRSYLTTNRLTKQASK